jgi:hypothetical protein
MLPCSYFFGVEKCNFLTILVASSSPGCGESLCFKRSSKEGEPPPFERCVVGIFAGAEKNGAVLDGGGLACGEDLTEALREETASDDGSLLGDNGSPAGAGVTGEEGIFGTLAKA